MGENDKERALRLLEELISIPSPTGQEGPLLKRLSRKLARLGLAVEVQRGPGGVKNLLARRGNPGLLLATHVDTVPPWGHPHAFSPHREGDEVWGRGALDAKGQITALLLALEEGRGDCLVALFSDEEGQGRGSGAFRPPADLALQGAVVLEPTGLKVAVAEAGSIELKVRVRGKAAHGTLSCRGDNAIEKFLRIYSRLEDLSFLPSSHPLFPPLRPNLGAIRGGIDPQVVPEECEAHLDIPIPPGVELDEAEGEIRGLLKGPGVEVRVTDREPPWQMGQGERGMLSLVEEAYRRAIGSPPQRWGMPSWTDAGNLRLMGIPALVLGAGDLALAHTPEERVRIEDVLNLKAVLKELLVLASSPPRRPLSP